MFANLVILITKLKMKIKMKNKEKITFSAPINTDKSLLEKQNQPSCLGAVYSHFSLLMLEAKLLTLEVQYKEANLQMLEYPNEYSDNVLREITPMLEDLRRAVSVLENGY